MHRVLPQQLISDTIYLRQLTVDDAKQHYLDWLADKDVNRYLESRFENYTIDKLKDYINGFDGENRFLFGAFDIKIDNHIGNITLEVNPFHNTAYFGYLIGNKDYWGTPAATEANCLILDFAFDVMNVRRVWGGIYKTNLPAAFNIHRLGFKREGILRDSLIDQGKITDGLQYGILKDEWKESKKKFEKIKRIIR